MRRTKCYTINGFSEDHKGGNPACVIPLEGWLEADHMQEIAIKMGLAETAFFRSRKRWLCIEMVYPRSRD